MIHTICSPNCNKKKNNPVLNLPTDNIGSKEVKIKLRQIFHFIEIIKVIGQ